MCKSLLTCSLIVFTLLRVYSQTASFATWKDNKRAAYTIIHDDFGDYVVSIYNTAYPLAKARGVKFCFGAITSNCGATEWQQARTMIADGFECVNHSHNHRCGGPASQCTGSLTYGPTDFSTELDLSTQLIESNTNVRPLFFIHPYDSWTQTILDYLKNNLGYLGSRAGTSGGINASNYTNYMNTDFFGFDNSSSAISSLKNALDQAITEGGYVMREFHGIADQSYGAISKANYIAHLDYVKSKIADGSVWSATATEVITYRLQRDAYTLATNYNASTGTINVNFTATKTLNTAQLRTPMTVNVNLGSIAGIFTTTQGTATIPTTQNGSIVSFNVYPYQGNVVLKTGTITPSQPNNVLNFAAKGQSTAAALTWTNPTSNFDEVMIVAKPSTAFTTQPSGTAYTADANFTGAGTAFEGGKVVYRGTGVNVTVTGLTNNTLYHFKAFSRLGTLWSSGVATSATPLATPPPSGFDATLCYRLSARHSSKVMSLSSLSTANGTTFVQNTWTGGREQIWRIKQVDATYYYLTSGLSGKAATVKNASTANLAPIIQSTYTGVTNQQFKFTANTEGYYVLSARHSSKVIDVYGDYVADNTAIIQYNPNGGANQQWLIESVGCPTGTTALAVQRVVAFNGYLNGNKGVLQWVVNSEDFKDYYEIEKQTETGDFKRLDVVNGNSTNALRVFSFTDESLEDGDNIYRLTFFDDKGRIHISDLVTIQYKKAGIYAVSPNPTSDMLNVDLSACENQSVDLDIIDMSGLIMRHIALEKAGKRQEIDLNDLAVGQYILHIQPKGKRRTTRVFVVTK